VFDLDGTVYMGDELLPGSARVLGALRELGRDVAFVSNNPTRTPSQYVDKLTRLGIEAHESEVINTIVTTVQWLRRECADARVFAIAEPPLLDALREAGIALCEDPAQIDVVVASFDRTLDYRKLQIAFDALWRRTDTRFVATNPDRYCPTPDGGQPDAGSVIAALEAAASRSCELHFGKPGAVMMETVLDRLGAAPEECVMVGDRLSTDMEAARQIGMRSALVLTGETRAQDLGAVPDAERPDYVLARIDELLGEDEWERRGWAA
jgi:HAD superfamily hydrolase (TIGR01450 family)